MNIYIYRHGLTMANRNGILQGHTDIPLTEEGFFQAQESAQKLQEIIKSRRGNIISAHTSDLLRSAQTAGVFVNRMRADSGYFPLIFTEKLREINLGRWEGRTREQLMAEKDENGVSDFERWLEDHRQVTPAGGETIIEFFNRSITAMEDILSSHRDKSAPEDSILLFSHGGVLSMIMNHLQGNRPGNLIRYDVPNAGGVWIDYIQTGENPCRFRTENVREWAVLY